MLADDPSNQIFSPSIRIDWVIGPCLKWPSRTLQDEV